MLAQMLWGLASGDPNADALFSNTSLLLHGDGANGSTAIKDVSLFAHTIAVGGNARISTAQSKFGGASLAFDGSGDWLKVEQSDRFDFGSGDFTVEFFYLKTGTPQTAARLFQTSDGDVTCALSISTNILGNQPNAVGVNISSNGTSWNVVDSLSPITVSDNVWTHIAVCRSGTTIRVFQDGVLKVSGTTSAALYNPSTPAPVIGGQSIGTSRSINGYIDEVRVKKGEARYTANFTPPTKAFPPEDPGTFSAAGGAVSAGASASSLSVEYPTGIQAGDLLVCHGLIQSDTVVGTISGWSNDTVPGSFTTFSTKVADGSETGSVTLNFNGSPSQSNAAIVRLRHTSGLTPKVQRAVSGTYSTNPSVQLLGPAEPYYALAHLVSYFKDASADPSGLDPDMTQLARRVTGPTLYLGFVPTSALGRVGGSIGATSASQITALASAIYLYKGI